MFSMIKMQNFAPVAQLITCSQHKYLGKEKEGIIIKNFGQF